MRYSRSFLYGAFPNVAGIVDEDIDGTVDSSGLFDVLLDIGLGGVDVEAERGCAETFQLGELTGIARRSNDFVAGLKSLFCDL